MKAVTTMDKPEVQTKEIRFRKLREINLEDLKSDIASADLIMADYNETPMAELANLYDSNLKEILEKHAPIISKVLRIKTVSPWFNNEVRQVKREKRAAEAKWKKTKADVDFDTFRNKRNHYIKVCSDAKREYYSSKVEACAGNQKQLCSLVSKLTTGGNSTKYPDETKETICKNFGDFFIDKIEGIRSQIGITVKQDGVENMAEYELSQNVPAFDKFKALSQQEVMDIIMKSPNKSCCLDPMPTELLKKCIDILIKPITAIVNKSLSTGRFPDCRKCALVTPLLKKLGLDLISKNYRPVSNVPFVAKIIEKSPLPQFVQSLQQNDLYSTQNSAYK